MRLPVALLAQNGLFRLCDPGGSSVTDSSDSRLRKYLREKKSELSAPLEQLWSNSDAIHTRQNRPGNPNEYGQIHVQAVENNIWRLLFDENNPNKEKNKRDIDDYEIFLLSAAACTHDFDKAKEELPPSIKHGQHSASIIRANRSTFGLANYQANDIGAAISLHGEKNVNRFKDKLKALNSEHASPHGNVNLSRVALLLKTADILHLDETRISSLMARIIDVDSLEKGERKKYLSRSCTRGWSINGSRVVVHAEPSDTKHEKAFVQCFNRMKTREWRAVTEGLRQYGFPHEIEYVFPIDETEKSKMGDTQMAKPHGVPQSGNIPLENDRFLRQEEVHPILSMLIERKDKYPICRNQSTTHAAASIAAILSVLTMLDRMNYLRNELKNRFLELLREREKNPRKLGDHIALLSESKSLLLRLIRDIPKISATTKTFQKLPGNDHVYKDLHDINHTLASCIDNMYAEYKQITREITHSRPTPTRMEKQMDSKKWSKDIGELFDQTKEALFFLCDDRILYVADSIKGIKRSIDQDWEKDVERTWEVENHAHRPTL